MHCTLDIVHLYLLKSATLILYHFSNGTWKSQASGELLNSLCLHCKYLHLFYDEFTPCENSFTLGIHRFGDYYVLSSYTVNSAKINYNPVTSLST